MNLFLAGLPSRKFLHNEFNHCKFALESFWSIPEWFIPYTKKFDLFLLDSGAFTFMNTCKNKEVDFDDYLTKYIKFINDNDVKYFFELDIDSIVGIEEVERLRKRLEKETGKKCIPVWHKSRGKEYFINMCEEYDYIAIGGIATKEIKPKEYKYFKWFIDTAHEHNCKIHGLGFTNLKLLKMYHFDSVDSTSWVSGGRFGAVYHFDGKNLKLVDTGNRRMYEGVSREGINRHNYYEWIKFQKYAEHHY